MSDAAFRPTIHTQADVEALWRALLSPLRFTSYSLWLVVIDGDRPIPALLEITRTEESPEPGDAEALAGVLRQLAGGRLRFAFLRSRPGTGRPDPADLAWARAVNDAGRRAGARLEVVHLAHDGDVCPLPLDDLLAQPA